MALITTAEVAPWVQSTAAELDEDPLAQQVLAAVSLLVNEAVWGVGGDANFWVTPDRPAPQTAKDIATQVFARVYTNPRNVQQEGATGPLGGDRLADIQLTGLNLRPDEIERLYKLRPGTEQGNGFWILSLHDTDTVAVEDTAQYVDAYGEMTVPGMTYFSGDYLHG